DGLEGRDSLARLEAEQGCLETARSRTGSGGLHLWFVTPPGVVVGNSAGRIGRGLDGRGDGGYGLAPPSLHPCGKRYTWEATGRMARMPGWLVELARKPDPPVRPALTVVRTFAPGQGGTSYGIAALRAEADAVRAAVQGTRNHT